MARPLGGSRITHLCCGDKIRGECLMLALLHLLLLVLLGVVLGRYLRDVLLPLPAAIVLVEYASTTSYPEAKLVAMSINSLALVRAL
jgi:hypothetical protein